jgi:hypothetical protein
MATRVLQGGDKLRRFLSEFSRATGRGGTLKVGFLEGAKYPDGTPVAMVAAIHNFGAPSRGIPPRPFFTNMITQHSAEWPDDIKSQLFNVVGRNYHIQRSDIVTVMNRMGALIKGQIQQSIRDTNAPPLAPATVRRKGFDKPLIETSHMINSVAFEYEER